MPFEKQLRKMLTGGINLLPPSDIIDDDQASKCVNWRVDQLGALRSRKGATPIYTGLGAYVHSLHRMDMPGYGHRYAGVDRNLYRDGVLVTDGFSGEQLGMCAYGGHLWVVNKDKQGRDNGTTWNNWLPDPPTKPAVQTASGYLSGILTYYVTYVTAEGYETNPSPASDPLTCQGIGDAGGAWITIPACPDSQVIGYRVYRAGGLLPVPYQILGWAADGNPIENWAVSPWDRNQTVFSDSGAVYDELGNDVTPDAPYIVERGVLLEDDHDPPPAAAVMASDSYFSRLVVGCSTEHPNRIWWTPSAEPWYFRGSASDDGDWLDVGELHEEVVAISPKPRMLIIYKEHSIWRVTGDLEGGILEQTNSDTGLIGRKAWAAHGLVDYIQGKEGIYVFNGDVAVKMSEKVDPIFKGLYSGKVEQTKPIDEARRAQAVMAVKHDRLYFSYPEV